MKLNLYTPHPPICVYIYFFFFFQFPQHFPGGISRLKTIEYFENSEINAYVIQEIN